MSNIKENPFVVENRMLTTKEAMAVLQIGRTKFSALVKAGEIKGIKIGKTWRFSRENIEHFIKGEPQE